MMMMMMMIMKYIYHALIINVVFTITILSFWDTKLSNQIRESTTLLYQIFQRLKMFTIDLRL